MGAVLRGWARSASGHTAEGISWIKDGIEDLRAAGSVMGLLSLLANSVGGDVHSCLQFRVTDSHIRAGQSAARSSRIEHKDESASFACLMQ